MSQILARARARFEATPRSLDDDELVRIARGDRGCLGDALSGLGAVTLVAAMILSALDMIAFEWAYLGVAIWIGGFAWGTILQSRSGTQRKGALESGPLVLGVVLRASAWLRRPGKRVGRAVALFCTEPARRFDRAWLEDLARQLERRLDAAAGSPEWVPLRALLADPDSFGVHRVPEGLLEGGDAKQLYLASLIVHPERLEGGYLGAEDDREAVELDLELDAPARLPTVLAIIDPERSFVEQIPRSSSPSEQDAKTGR
ncbi:MAG: hypothetical protein R6X02_06330 [Enhygromyxa sp.]